MKKTKGVALSLICAAAALSGCSRIGDRSGSVIILYYVTAIASLLLLAGYCRLVRKKDGWFVVLFSSMLVVNAGYLMLSLSPSLDRALAANRVAYLGSVCMTPAMLMIIARACGMTPGRKWQAVMASVAAAVFLIAASPGYSRIYYSEVSLVHVNGAAVLEKVYGPWHPVYLVYLTAYFIAMAGIVIRAMAKKPTGDAMNILFPAGAVFVNMGVWLLEQIVRVDFELLSVSYIISGLFLLAQCLATRESAEEMPGEDAASEAEQPTLVPEIPAEEPIETNVPTAEESAADAEQARLAFFASQIPNLTPTERLVFNFYIEGRSTKEIMAELNIKENTLKYHNKNIYGKLGVSSRKQLVQLASGLKKA